MVRTSVLNFLFRCQRDRNQRASGCRNNPAWQRMFRVVSGRETTKITASEGTKSGLDAETVPPRWAG
jgi:hypothetical protein